MDLHLVFYSSTFYYKPCCQIKLPKAVYLKTMRGPGTYKIKCKGLQWHSQSPYTWPESLSNLVYCHRPCSNRSCIPRTHTYSPCFSDYAIDHNPALPDSKTPFLINTIFLMKISSGKFYNFMTLCLGVSGFHILYLGRGEGEEQEEPWFLRLAMCLQRRQSE